MSTEVVSLLLGDFFLIPVLTATYKFGYFLTFSLSESPRVIEKLNLANGRGDKNLKWTEKIKSLHSLGLI